MQHFVNQDRSPGLPNNPFLFDLPREQ